MAPRRRLWHVLRAVLFMLRKGMSSKRPKLAGMDLHLLLLRGKTTVHREVEFNTPSLQIIPTTDRRTHRGANGGEPGWYNYDAADIGKVVFEVLNDNDEQMLNDDAGHAAAAALCFGRSLAPPVSVTDSPFPVRDEDQEAEDVGGMVDQEADEFIRRFYSQLRTQQSAAAASPDYGASPSTATGVAST